MSPDVGHEPVGWAGVALARSSWLPGLIAPPAGFMVGRPVGLTAAHDGYRVRFQLACAAKCGATPTIAGDRLVAAALAAHAAGRDAVDLYALTGPGTARTNGTTGRPGE